MKLTCRVLGKWSAVAAMLVLLSACETTTGPDTAKPNCPPGEERLGKMAVIGEVEWVNVAPEGVRQKARIDTGAQTTSIGVTATQKFERDGKAWVKFTIKNRETGKQVEMKRPIERIAKIKRHNAEAVERYVVNLNLQLGKISETAEVTLADREQFKFPVLIGRNFLDGIAVVDVSQKFMALDSDESPDRATDRTTNREAEGNVTTGQGDTP